MDVMTDEPKKKRGRGRPRTFQLVQNAHGKVGGRVTRTIDGETVRKRVKLETSDDAVAKIKLRRLAHDPSAPVAVASSDETFMEAAIRVNADRIRAGIYRAKDELDRIKNHASAIADIPITSVTSKDIKRVMKAMQAAGGSRQSVKHLRGYIKLTFDALVDDDDCLVASNPVLATKLPEFRKTVKKIRAVLEDAELFVYLDYKHPRAFHQIAVFQRQVMSCVARCLGGQRTNDLHESRWEQFVIADGAFPSALVLRTKGKQLDRMAVAPMLRPFLRAWWIEQGRPLEGLMFPTLRGKRLGQVKRKVSQAHALRQDLQRAFGLERWDETGGKRKSGAFVTAREMTARERELFVESRTSLPVDFHSWRRAFVQAVDGVELDAKVKRQFSGHETEAVRQIYVQSTKRREWVVPAEALPSRAATLAGDVMVEGGILGQLPALNQEAGVFVEPDSSDVTATYIARPKGFEPLTSGSGGRRSIR
jgi:hypothetical protein